MWTDKEAEEFIKGAKFFFQRHRKGIAYYRNIDGNYFIDAEIHMRDRWDIEYYINWEVNVHSPYYTLDEGEYALDDLKYMFDCATITDRRSFKIVWEYRK